jgi:hypothetical protein
MPLIRWSDGCAEFADTVFSATFSSSQLLSQTKLESLKRLGKSGDEKGESPPLVAQSCTDKKP